MPAFAVVACSRCRTAWAVETRHRTSTCPRCPTQVDLRRRTRFWVGDDARDAQQAAAAVQAALGQGQPPLEAATAAQALMPAQPLARHDSAVDAAAAKARAVVNASARADIVALWLTRLVGDARDEDYMAALEKAGIPPERAEKEIVRMLATDILFEPRAGWYRALQA